MVARSWLMSSRVVSLRDGFSNRGEGEGNGLDSLGHRGVWGSKIGWQPCRSWRRMCCLQNPTPHVHARFRFPPLCCCCWQAVSISTCAKLPARDPPRHRRSGRLVDDRAGGMQIICITQHCGFGNSSRCVSVAKLRAKRRQQKLSVFVLHVWVYGCLIFVIWNVDFGDAKACVQL